VTHWSGCYSNGIEQSTSADVALHVARTHDLGDCSTSNFDTIEYDASLGLRGEFSDKCAGDYLSKQMVKEK